MAKVIVGTSIPGPGVNTTVWVRALETVWGKQMAVTEFRGTTHCGCSFGPTWYLKWRSDWHHINNSLTNLGNALKIPGVVFPDPDIEKTMQWLKEYAEVADRRNRERNLHVYTRKRKERARRFGVRK